ncbi:hypothetical protein L6452_26727 [Arctium lappa]|uniref:Uncharacterized protein n=1 Tax=Arctium lappa TaxID=4217 RepID=A0ACB8ZWI8_ARCLA|nr:hypothetical protein L6452_26727 [Arctium lappa]
MDIIKLHSKPYYNTHTVLVDLHPTPRILSISGGGGSFVDMAYVVVEGNEKEPQVEVDGGLLEVDEGGGPLVVVEGGDEPQEVVESGGGGCGGGEVTSASFFRVFCGCGGWFEGGGEIYNVKENVYLSSFN